MKHSTLVLGSLVLSCCLAPTLCAGTMKGEAFGILDTINLTSGEGGWDYCTVDDSSGRLFVSHENQVHVVDIAGRTQIAVIHDTKGVHGIALAPPANKAYISDGKDTSVTVIDLKTLGVIAKIHVTGVGPDAITYDPYSQSVLTFNGKSSSATVIDTKSDKVTATIDLGGKPEFPTSDGAGLVYDNLEDKGEVAVISMKSMKVEKTWSVAPASEPCAMAIDKKDNRLFIGCRSKVLLVMDATNGKVMASLPIGDHVDAVAFDEGKQLIFCSNGDGTVSVIKKSGKDGYQGLGNIMTRKGSKTMALSQATHHLYLPAAEYDIPEATADNPRPHSSVKPGSFCVLEVGPEVK